MASIAQMTGTLVDSGCKHIIPVRVSYNFFVDRCSTGQDALLRNKMKYSVHKFDLVLCVGTHIFRKASQTYSTNDAYPPVISTILENDMELDDRKKLALCYLYAITERMLKMGDVDNFGFYDGLPQTFVKALRIMTSGDRARNGLYSAETLVTDAEAVLEEAANEDDNVNLSEEEQNFETWVMNLPDFRFMGVSLGLAYAHPSSGDNVVSSMIGGMVTIRNGDFPVRTGDRIMWYFYFERGFFDSTGRRFNIDRANNGNEIRSSNQIFLSDEDPLRSDRYKFMLQQQGIYDKNLNDQNFLPKLGNTAGKIPAIQVKPYFEDFTWDSRPYDRMRVIGKAVSNARPYDQVDLLICTQCI